MLPLIALAFALRLFHLDKQSLWFDEIVIVALAKMSWYDGFIAALGQGMQLTPVFHGIIKLWLLVGDSDWLLRFPAVLFNVLTLPLLFHLGRLYFDKSVGLLATFLFAINPFQIWYAQELKLYALLPFIAAGAMYSFCQMIRTRGEHGLGLLILFNLIGLPAHYFMFLISTVQFLYLILNFKSTHLLLYHWIIAQAIGVFPLILWWVFIIQQQFFTVGIGWIPIPYWYSLLLTLWNVLFLYTGTLSIVTVMALIVVIISLGFGFRSMETQINWRSLMMLWLLFPPIITFVLSFGQVSFYVDRYFLIVTPILTIFMAIGLLNLPGRLLRWSVLLFFIIVTGLGVWRVYFDNENFSKEDWRKLAYLLDTRVEPDHLVITCTDGHWLSLEYYNAHHKLTTDNIIFAAQIPEVSKKDYNIAWVVDMHEGLSIHSLVKSTPPILDRALLPSEVAIWEKNSLQDIIIVSGISAYQYQLTDTRFLKDVVDWHCQN